MDALTLAQKLLKFGIQTRPFFWPMNKQKALLDLGLFKSQTYPNSEFLSKYGLYVPASLDITSKEITYVCSAINNILKN